VPDTGLLPQQDVVTKAAPQGAAFAHGKRLEAASRGLASRSIEMPEPRMGIQAPIRALFHARAPSPLW
jgi:hypothetical protein